MHTAAGDLTEERAEDAAVALLGALAENVREHIGEVVMDEITDAVMVTISAVAECFITNPEYMYRIMTAAGVTGPGYKYGKRLVEYMKRASGDDE